MPCETAVALSTVLGCSLGLIRKDNPSLLQEHQLSGSSSVDAILNVCQSPLTNRFELNGIIMVQTGHVVHKSSELFS